jgi:hypothetical protein
MKNEMEVAAGEQLVLLSEADGTTSLTLQPAEYLPPDARCASSWGGYDDSADVPPTPKE